MICAIRDLAASPWRLVQPGVLLVEFPELQSWSSSQRWPFFAARRSYSGARVQS